MEEDEEGLHNEVAADGSGESFRNILTRRDPLLFHEDEDIRIPNCSSNFPARRLDFSKMDATHKTKATASGNDFMPTHKSRNDENDFVSTNKSINDEDDLFNNSRESNTASEGFNMEEDNFYDLDQQCAVVESTDDENDGDVRKRGKYCLFNERIEKVYFSLGIMFKDKAF